MTTAVSVVVVHSIIPRSNHRGHPVIYGKLQCHRHRYRGRQMATLFIIRGRLQVQTRVPEDIPSINSRNMWRRVLALLVLKVNLPFSILILLVVCCRCGKLMRVCTIQLADRDLPSTLILVRMGAVVILLHPANTRQVQVGTRYHRSQRLSKISSNKVLVLLLTSLRGRHPTRLHPHVIPLPTLVPKQHRPPRHNRHIALNLSMRLPRSCSQAFIRMHTHNSITNPLAFLWLP